MSAASKARGRYEWRLIRREVRDIIRTGCGTVVSVGIDLEAFNWICDAHGHPHWPEVSRLYAHDLGNFEVYVDHSLEA